LGGMPPRRGAARCSVASRCMWCSESVLEGERCLPAYTRRRSASGSEVRTERRVVRFCMDRSMGTVSAIAVSVSKEGSWEGVEVGGVGLGRRWLTLEPRDVLDEDLHGFYGFRRH
jgi:hypothetical protein